MSNQRNYVPWNKSGSSVYSGSSRKDIPSSTAKKQGDSTKKLDYERSISSKIGSTSGTTSFGDILRSNFNTGYRDRSSNSKIKPVLNKTDTSHPPVSYSLLPRRGGRSRDASPIGNSEISSSVSPKFNYNRLYPTPHQRSVSRERIESTTSSPVSNISEKSGSNWNDLVKYNNCKPASSKDGIPKYTGRLPFSRDDSIASRYKLGGSRATSREDLSKASPKYIKSRFLPKNSVEKSQTAQTKISTVKPIEPSRRNKELLNVLQVQQARERLSRSTSRCSSLTSEEHSAKHTGSIDKESADRRNEQPVVSRGSSPAQASGNCVLGPGKLETDTKKSVHTMVDKGIQSDGKNDSAEASTSVRSSKNVATPWSSFLDMEFSRPDTKFNAPIKRTNSGQNEKNESPEGSVLSRTSSTSSLAHVKCHPTDESRNTKKPSTSSKSKGIPSKKPSDKKQLPPQIPKPESPSRSSHSQPTVPTNKDFRKSILNMSPAKRQGRSSNSGSSAESEIVDPDNTDVSENLTSCSSYHLSNTSRLPQRGVKEDLRRSPSLETSVTNTSGSDDDGLRKKGKRKLRGAAAEPLFRKSPSSQSISRSKDGGRPEADAKSFLMRALAPVTNLFKTKPHNSTENINWMESATDSEVSNHLESEIHAASSGDPHDKSGSQPGMQQKNINFEQKPISAKIILHIVEPGGSDDLVPATEEISVQQSSTGGIGSEESSWWLDKNGNKTETEEVYPNSGLDEKQNITTMRTNNSDNSSWWLNSSEKQNNPNTSNSSCMIASKSLGKQELRHVDSEDRPWWLSSSENVPETVQETEQSGEVKPKYPIRHQDSGERPWWLEEATELKATESEVVDDQKPKYAIRHQDSGEKPWWLEEAAEVNAGENKSVDVQKPKYAIRHQDSGEKPWWLQGEAEGQANDDGFADDQIPIGDRASPEGLEMCDVEAPPSGGGDSSRVLDRANQFISGHTNIDDVLGCSTQIWGYSTKDATQVQFVKGNTPCRNFLQTGGTKNTEAVFRLNLGRYLNDIDPFNYISTFPDPARPPLHTFSTTLPLIDQLAAIHRLLKSPHRLDDAALQLYRDGDYGSYLDLEASISEQQEEFDGFQSNRKNSIVLRTQLSVRVHNIIEKLLTSEGRELRRALFSLKQVFQEDKDLVHEFVQNDGLSCLIKVGSEADQNYLNYILRALGQVMLYVDGMNGVMEHNQTIQWLYSLISSKFRLVVKTALKLLLVFVEYADSNCALLIKAIRSVDYSEGVPFYHNIMKLLKDFEFADTELLIYAMTLVNRILNGVSDQDTYYDQIDPLEEQGLESVIQKYTSKPGTDLDLLQQFRIYEAVLRYEDGAEPSEKPVWQLDDGVVKAVRNRKPVVDSTSRRKSRRHSTGNSPMSAVVVTKGANSGVLQTSKEDVDYESSSSQSSAIDANLRGSNNKTDKDVGVTPALKRRRERAERQESFIKEQECTAFFHEENGNENGTYANTDQRLPNRNRTIYNILNRRDAIPISNTADVLDPEENQPRICSMTSNQETGLDSDCTNENERSLLLQLKRENTVKDLTQKLANQSIVHSPSEENKMNRIGDMSGLISKAKEGLAKSKTKSEILKPTSESLLKMEAKKSENELRWEELTGNLNRSLSLCDMDFTDLVSEDEIDILAPITLGNGIPPPPPLMEEMGSAPPPPPLSNRIASSTTPSSLVFGSNFQKTIRTSDTKSAIQKNKKTVKLFWKEVRDECAGHVKLKTGSIWDELYPVSVDTQKLEHLFETRARDLNTKKQQETNKNKEIIVLDPKRSNAINIGMTKLPPSRSIKTAILKMDATIMNREGIDKLLTMLPTEEERTKIQDAQAANPDLPLGSAEQFLLTLASISELPARLKLWAFKLDFENSEREIAEPLMDLKQGIEVLRGNYTFRGILSTLLSIGNFLNGNEVKGFQIEYLAKVPEVKDTVHKHSLLHHLCHTVMEKFPNSTDLYSEVGAITRASKVDFDELSSNVQTLKSDCKSSWDHLKLIAKHDGSTTMKVKMSDFLSDCAERIILLGIIHRRIMNRFHKFLLWLGIPLHQISDTKPNEFCRIVSEFALEYRTTRERVLQQLEKKANHRERNKTRGKMITDVGKFKTKEDKADAELRTLLGSDLSDVESVHGTLPWRRTRRDGNMSFKRATNGNFTDDDDEILECLVKSATKGSSARNTLRERKRTRHVERKSLRRTLKNGLSEEEKKHLSVYIEGYQL